jgi:hypothetical protein
MERRVALLQHQALRRVHDGSLGSGDAEGGTVKALGKVQESAKAGMGSLGGAPS